MDEFTVNRSTCLTKAWIYKGKSGYDTQQHLVENTMSLLLWSIQISSWWVLVIETLMEKNI